MNYIITVFTPTYNRAYTLPRLYDSLLKQTNKDFEWLIVDDGSTDNSESLIASFKSENKIDINYVKQANGGKHRAINKGVDLAMGEYFFIVDSDDFLPADSIQVITNYLCKINNPDIIAGFVGRKFLLDGTLTGQIFPKDEFISDHIEKTYIMGLKGDLAEVIRTEVVRQYKFPDFENERFCAEGLMWNRISQKYKYIFSNVPVYCCEYLAGGLSAHSIKNRRNNPQYATTIYSELVKDKRLPLLIKMRTYINFWRFAFFVDSSIKQKLNSIDSSLLGLLMLPLSIVVVILDYIKIK